MKPRIPLLASASLALTAFFGCTAGPGGPGTGYHMGPGGYGMGGGWTWLLLIIVAAVVIYAFSRRGRDSGGGTPRETPLEIARRRYAAGEITKEEFEELKKDISD